MRCYCVEILKVVGIHLIIEILGWKIIIGYIELMGSLDMPLGYPIDLKYL